MSWKDQFWAGQAKASGKPSLPDDFRAKYPTLTEVLEGHETSDQAGTACPTASLVLFAESTQLKFCVTPRTGNRVAFGCLPRALDGLDGVEAELAAGKFEWKLSKRR